jgi:hypothetical protein
VQKLFSVEAGVLEAPNRTRILFSIITVADTEEEALQYAQQKYPEALAEGTERRVVAIKAPDNRLACGRSRDRRKTLQTVPLLDLQ